MIYQENFPFHNKPKDKKSGSIYRFLGILFFIGALIFAGVVLVKYFYQVGQSDVNIANLPIHKKPDEPYKEVATKDDDNNDVKFLDKTIFDSIQNSTPKEPIKINIAQSPEEPILQIDGGLSEGLEEVPEMPVVPEIDIAKVVKNIDFTKPKPNYKRKSSSSASSKPKRIVVNESKGNYYVVLSKVHSYKEATKSWEELGSAVKSILSPKRAMVTPNPAGDYSVEAGPFKKISDARAKCRLIKKHSDYCKVINKL